MKAEIVAKRAALTRINDALAEKQEALELLQAVADAGRFCDDAAKRRAAIRRAQLEEEILQLTMEKHTRFQSGDPVQDKALQALSMSSDSGRLTTSKLVS